MGNVEKISLFPIKGLRGFDVGVGDDCPDVEMTTFGLKVGLLRDRCFIVGTKDSQGKFDFVTMRVKPKLALITVAPNAHYTSLMLSAPEMPSIHVTFPSIEKLFHIRFNTL